MGASNVTAGTDHSAPEANALLMELVVSRENMMAAYARVVGNKGAAGIDKMSVTDLKPFLVEHWSCIKEDLLADRYQPQAVRGVSIPKPGGGMRQLGIPTAVDRLIQQALHQVLMPLFDPGFSPHSYGFRPGRSAHDAVKAARDYVADQRRFVVDMDLEKFFDRVNHDVLMARVARKVRDKRVLRLIRRYLQAGLMQSGVETQRMEGTPRRGEARLRHDADRFPRYYRIYCSMISTRNWRNAATLSAGMRMIATSTLPQSAPVSGLWPR
jgi:RNA-directed DNA polymerase